MAARRAGLDSALAVFTAVAHRRATKSTYLSLQRQFVGFALSYGISLLEPLSELDLARLVALYCLTHKHTTLYVFLAAVRDWSLRVGFGELPSGFLLERVRQGIRATYGVAEATTPKDALRHADLLAVRRRLDFLDWNSVCVWCMLTFAFFGLLRISEYTGGALRVRDVVLDDQGILLTIPVSKGSLRPEVVRLPRRDHDFACPVVAFAAYSAQFLQERADDEAFFLFGGELDGSPATAPQFRAYIKGLVKAVLGKDPARYSGHSLRRGGTTWLFEQGVPEAVIQKQGRWRGLTFRRYLHNFGQVELLQPAAALRKEESVRAFGGLR